jgi:hypothetical protein
MGSSSAVLILLSFWLTSFPESFDHAETPQDV